MYSLASPNIQEGVDEVLNPEIYNRGIVRVCATENPGQSTDPNYQNPDEARWIDVGYCDTQNIRCWLDRESVRDVIESTTLEEQALENVAQDTLAELLNSELYLDDVEYAALVNELNELVKRSENGEQEAIKLIHEAYNPVLEGIKKSLSELNITIDEYVPESKS